MIRRVVAVAAAAMALAAGSLSAQAAQTTRESPARSAAPADSMELARSFNDWMWSIEIDSLWAHLDQSSRTLFGSADNLADQIFGFIQQNGVETSLVSEALARSGDTLTYERVMRLDASPTPWRFTWTYGAADGLIRNVNLQPVSENED
jgi:opacity protein-like surface antigen